MKKTRRLAAILLMIVVMLGGCRKDVSRKETGETNTAGREISGEEDSADRLKEEGYEFVEEIAYVKLNDGECRIFYVSDESEKSLYLAAKIMMELKDIHSLIITWNGKEYTASEEQAQGKLEDFWKLFPEDWHETIDNAMRGSGIQYIVSKETADKIDNAVEKLIQSQDINNDYGEDQENNQTESNIEVVDKFEWEYDENNNFTIGLTKDKESGILSVSVFGHYSDENIGLAQNDYIMIFAMSYSSGIDSSIICSVGEDSYLMTMNNGKILMNTFPSEIEEDIPEIYLDSVKQMMKSLEDFYVKNGLKEKTYNEIVYEDENVKIYFAGIDDKGVNFNVENMSEKQVTIQADSIAINGISTNSIIMSDEVAPISTGKVTARCSEFSSDIEIERISGVLRIIGIKERSYEATFVNVEIE